VKSLNEELIHKMRYNLKEVCRFEPVTPTPLNAAMQYNSDWLKRFSQTISSLSFYSHTSNAIYNIQYTVL